MRRNRCGEVRQLGLAWSGLWMYGCGRSAKYLVLLNSPFDATECFLLSTFYLLPCCFLLATFYLLPSTCYLLLSTCCLLPSTFYFLLSTCCLLPCTLLLRLSFYVFISVLMFQHFTSTGLFSTCYSLLTTHRCNRFPQAARIRSGDARGL